jgi:sugar O-acyltransferase (sialic acid O-acetyltransferase NeuD family)
MNNDAVIFGYSGHAYVVLDILISNHYNLAGYFDNEEKKENPFKLQYLGTEQNEIVFKEIEIFNAFIGIGNNNIRARLYKKLIANKINCPVAVHNKSTVSSLTHIGSGTTIMAGAIINAMAKVGCAVICNSSSVVEHECIIGNYVHIAPGAILAGNVTVGENSFIGANCVIKQGVTIGSNVIVGAGAVVTKDIPDGLTVYGNPAKWKVG